jgi:hypothetical protein
MESLGGAMPSATWRPVPSATASAEVRTMGLASGRPSPTPLPWSISAEICASACSPWVATESRSCPSCHWSRPERCPYEGHADQPHPLRRRCGRFRVGQAGRFSASRVRAGPGGRSWRNGCVDPDFQPPCAASVGAAAEQTMSAQGRCRTTDPHISPFRRVTHGHQGDGGRRQAG